MPFFVISNVNHAGYNWDKEMEVVREQKEIEEWKLHSQIRKMFRVFLIYPPWNGKPCPLPAQNYAFEAALLLWVL